MLKVFICFLNSRKEMLPGQQLPINKEQSADVFTALSVLYAPGEGFILLHKRNNVHKLQAEPTKLRSFMTPSRHDSSPLCYPTDVGMGIVGNKGSIGSRCCFVFVKSRVQISVLGISLWVIL
jgi:hypothetical protein